MNAHLGRAIILGKEHELRLRVARDYRPYFGSSLKFYNCNDERTLIKQFELKKSTSIKKKNLSFLFGSPLKGFNTLFVWEI